MLYREHLETHKDLVGSGVEPSNLAEYFELADVFIVGSWFKRDGHWANPPQKSRVDHLVCTFRELQQARGSR